MTKQYAIDRAKLFYREKRKSYYVVQMSSDDYAVMDKQELEQTIAETGMRSASIIFSIEYDRSDEEEEQA
jgi:hypothetical protein